MSTGPGAMAFTRMPSGAHSTASVFVRLRTPGLGGGRVHGSGVARPGIGRDDVQDRASAARVAQRPRDRARRVEGAVQDDVDDGAPAVRREVDRRGEEVPGCAVDQQLGRSELGDDAVDAGVCTATGSRTSVGTASARAPSAAQRATVSSSGSGLRPQTATSAPSAASDSAIARPIPLPPPVISATFPVDLAQPAVSSCSSSGIR